MHTNPHPIPTKKPLFCSFPPSFDIHQSAHNLRFLPQTHMLEITKATDKISRMHGQAISLSQNRAFVASLGFLLWLHKYCGEIYANNDFRVAREILRNIFEVNQFIHVCLISFFPMCICTFQQFFASISSFSSKIFLKK